MSILGEKSIMPPDRASLDRSPRRLSPPATLPIATPLLTLNTVAAPPFSFLPCRASPCLSPVRRGPEAASLLTVQRLRTRGRQPPVRGRAPQWCNPIIHPLSAHSLQELHGEVHRRSIERNREIRAWIDVGQVQNWE